MSRNYMVEVQYKGSAQVRNSGNYNLNSRPFGIIPDGKGGMMDLNLPENAAYRNTWLNNPQVSRPWNAWGDINYAGNNGHLSHHEGMVKIEKRLSQGLSFLAFYTLQKTLEGNSGNPYLNWGLLKTRSNYDQRHNFTGTMNYQLPVGKGRRFMNRGGWVNYLLGGYDMVWAYTITSGAPLGVSITGANTQQYPGWMPNFGNVILLKSPSMRDNWQDLGGARFNQNTQNQAIACGEFRLNSGNECFTYKPSFSLGTDNAYVFDQQRIIAASVSIGKDVPIKERLTFQFRLDFQNPFKWYNWGAPATALGINSLANSKTFGTYTPGSEGTTASYGGLPMMNITLALKW